MQIQSKDLVTRKPLLLKYTLFCKNCNHMETVEGKPSDALALLSKVCPACSAIPITESVSTGPVEEKVYKVKPIFIPKPVFKRPDFKKKKR